MKQRVNILQTAGLLWLLCNILLVVSFGQEDAGPKKNARRSPPLALFNGSDLENWSSWLVDTRHKDPRHVFSVTNGLLRISGEGLGYIRSRTVHANYHIVVEFRWGEKNLHWGNRLGRARDSGLFLHATGPDGNSIDGEGAFMAAIECNIFEGATGDFLLIRGKETEGTFIRPTLTARVAETTDQDGWFTWDPRGKEISLRGWGRINWKEKSTHWQDIKGFRGTADQEKPAGEWNRVECLCRNDTIEIRLNGQRVNRAYSVWPAKGHILLQCEGSEIFFRRVDLYPLD